MEWEKKFLSVQTKNYDLQMNFNKTGTWGDEVSGCRLKVSKGSRVLLLKSINRVNWIILARDTGNHSLGNFA